MHFTLSSLGPALVLSSLCGSAFAFPKLWASRPESVFEKRNVCVYDDYLLSLNAFLPDTQPFCSSYLKIPLDTITGSTTTARTTTTEISTSERSGSTVTTTDLVTETMTTTIRGLKKRAPAPSPAARIEATVWLSRVQRDAIADTSIASALSSACSCLSVTPSTTTITPTVSTTRTLSAVDYEYPTVALTRTTTTVATVIIAPTVTAYSSSRFPLPSANATLTNTPSPYPVNVTSSRESSSESTSRLSSISSTSESSTSRTSTLESSTSKTSTSESSTSRTSTSESSTSKSSATPTATAAPLVPDGCPAINGTTITATDGEVFLVLCNTDFGGGDGIGLTEANLQSCVEVCSIANDGFSANQCMGVTFRPQLVKNCYLKSNVSHPTTNATYEVVSAILIKPLNATNATNTTTYGGSSNSSSSAPTLPTFNTTAPPLGSTATHPLNISSLVASITPSASLNETGLASITPSPSANTTTPPASYYMPSVSMNESRSEWTSVCSNCRTVSTSTIYSTSTVFVTMAAPTI